MMSGRQNCCGNLVLGVTALGVRDEEPGLLRLVLGRERGIRGRRAATIGNSERSQNIAEGINLQCERVADARVGRVALVMVAQSLSGMSKENRMAIAEPWLDSLEREVLLDDSVGRGSALLLLRRGVVIRVEGVDLLAQHHTPESTARLAFLLERQLLRENSVREQPRRRLIVR